MFLKDFLLSVSLLMCGHRVYGDSENVTIECGRSQQMLDECFQDLAPELKEFLQSTKIATNEKDIVSKCTVFRKGMSCFDEYTHTCLNNSTISLFENNVSGARKFLNKLCDDRRFQANYLRHIDCFVSIQNDWRQCTKKFQTLLSEELMKPEETKNRKFMQFCCLRHAYENCVYNSARFKCYKNSAKFVKDAAILLSDEKQFNKCRQYESVLCSGCGNFVTFHILVFVLLLSYF